MLPWAALPYGATPRLIVLDEPSMDFSPIYVNEIFDIIQKINEDGTTVLLVEQNAKGPFHCRQGLCSGNRYYCSFRRCKGTDEQRSGKEGILKRVIQVNPCAYIIKRARGIFMDNFNVYRDIEARNRGRNLY